MIKQIKATEVEDADKKIKAILELMNMRKQVSQVKAKKEVTESDFNRAQIGFYNYDIRIEAYLEKIKAYDISACKDLVAVLRRGPYREDQRIDKNQFMKQEHKRSIFS